MGSISGEALRGSSHRFCAEGSRRPAADAATSGCVYPRQTMRPVMQRLQTGLVSSHLMRRALEKKGKETSPC